MIVTARQHYGYKMEHGRRASAAEWAPIRIDLRTLTVDLTPSLRSFLMDMLLPASIAWLREALSVQPASAPLLAARRCSAYFTGTTRCAEEGGLPVCGVADATGSFATIDPSLLAGLEVCSSCSGQDSCTGCSTTSAGPGAADADFVLFASAVKTTWCEDSNTLAYATTCQRDQEDRPVFGFVNFCPLRLSAAANDWEAQLAVAIHEVLHALGFSSTSWPLFRYADGSPRTLRAADGLPPKTVDFECVDGVKREVRVPSSNTLVVGTERGVRVNLLVTPRVLSVARDLFGCADLQGAALENQPTSSGACFGSHFEQRDYMNEVRGRFSMPMHGHLRTSTSARILSLAGAGSTRLCRTA